MSTQCRRIIMGLRKECRLILITRSKSNSQIQIQFNQPINFVMGGSFGAKPAQQLNANVFGNMEEKQSGGGEGQMKPEQQ